MGKSVLNMHMKVPPMNNTPAIVKQGVAIILTNSSAFQEKNTTISNVFNNLL